MPNGAGSRRAAAGTSVVRALVADDHPLNRRVMALLLDELQIGYVMVADGAAAVDAVSRGGFDLVFMDIRMPVMDGLAATRAIRGDPRTAALPIVAVTAEAGEEASLEMLAAGIDVVVAKPVSLRELLNALAWVLGGRAAEG